MKYLFNYRNIWVFILLITAMLFTISCAPKPRTAVGEMDTPAHHVNVGMKFLDQGNLADAQREFDLALQLSNKYSQAHVGTALVKAYRNDFKGALKSMETAEDLAKTQDEKEFMKIGFIRVHTMNKANDKKWLDRAKDEYDDIVKKNPRSSAAHFFMGKAYKEAYDFNKSGQMFAKVIELKGDYTAQADSEWNLMQKIQRALPGTTAGKKIALREKVTRADVAALFIEELKIDVIYKKKTVKTFDTSFKDPEKAKEVAAKKPLSAKDVADHPLRSDIEEVLKMQIRGLEVFPDGAFRPNEFIDRATYAMMIEDILIKVSGDNALATKFIGNTSPFPDLRADLPYFNAVMVLTSRGIMEAKDISSGEFAPAGPVPGVDALLVIRKLKDELKIF